MIHEENLISGNPPLYKRNEVHCSYTQNLLILVLQIYS